MGGLMMPCTKTHFRRNHQFVRYIYRSVKIRSDRTTLPYPYRVKIRLPYRIPILWSQLLDFYTTAILIIFLLQKCYAFFIPYIFGEVSFKTGIGFQKAFHRKIGKLRHQNFGPWIFGTNTYTQFYIRSRHIIMILRSQKSLRLLRMLLR